MYEKKVSIITPLYNAENYIEETINSVINQTYKNWEFLIIDDFSEDNGPEIVKKYLEKDERIKLLEMKESSCGHVEKVRNFGIKSASGCYIAFLDSDDLWEKNKLCKQIKFMEENNYSFSFTQYQQISESGKKLNKIIRVPKELNYKKALIKNSIGCLTVVYNQNKIGKIFMPEAEKREDYACWLYVLKNITNAYGLNENLAYYRLRKNSFSGKKYKLLKYQWNLYRKVEKLNYFESCFYLLCVVFQKIIGIK